MHIRIDVILCEATITKSIVKKDYYSTNINKGVIYIYHELKELSNDESLGYVYILQNPESKLIKVGITKNPQHRFSTLSNQNGSMMNYYLSPAMYIENIVEKVMHSKLDFYRVKGEWFRCDYEKAINILNEILDSDDFRSRNFKR